MKFWEVVLIIVMMYRAVSGIVRGCLRNPTHKLHAIEKYKAAGCCTIAKISCRTITGTEKFPQHNLEYVYKVDDRLYYITYQLTPNLLDNNPKKKWFSSTPLRKFFKQDTINEAELLNFSDTLILYFNPRFPRKALCKQEVFIAPEALKRIRTHKENPHRMIDSDWNHPIDLRQF